LILKKRFRGYISSRPFSGERAPQHIQNLVIRTYCEEFGYEFLLSATEVAMPDAYIVLNRLMSGRGESDGLVFYSLRQLPASQDHRREFFNAILESGREVHFAVERMAIQSRADINRVDQILCVEAVLPYVPNLRGWYRAQNDG
jgi:sporadic carbohydrate cluster protein (TIGR04323 family)|tara:strand:- start:276 stop:707 length:432 start_codon:yes stop_codon:yes gene_type:complete